MIKHSAIKEITASIICLRSSRLYFLICFLEWESQVGAHQRTLHVRTSNITKGGGKMILLVSVLEILWGLRIDLMPDGKIYLKALSHSSLVEPLIKNSRSSTERCGQTF